MKFATYSIQCWILYLLPMLVLGGEPSSSQEVDRDERLRRVSERRFAVTTERLALATNTNAKCSLLATALSQELREPSTVRKHNSYLTQSEAVQMKYIEKLSSFGTNALPYLGSLSSSASGQPAPLLVIGRAMAGDPESRSSVATLLEESDEPFIRMMAVRALGTAYTSAARPLLEEALSDSFSVEARDSVGTYRIYPIREEACRVLKKMGVEVVRNGDRFEVEQ